MADQSTNYSETAAFKSTRTKAFSESLVLDHHNQSSDTELCIPTNSLPCLTHQSPYQIPTLNNNFLPMLYPALPNPFSNSPNQRPHPSVFPSLYPGLTNPQIPSAWTQFLPFYNYPNNLLPGASPHSLDQIAAMAFIKPSRPSAGPAANPGMFNSNSLMQKPGGSYTSGLANPSGPGSIDHSARLIQQSFLSSLPGSSAFRIPPSGMNPFQPISLFQKGTPIRLASGEIRPVEEMKTDDFYKNIERYPNQRVEKAIVRQIDRNYSTGKATIEFHVRNKLVIHETLLEVPFYVADIGWSSCEPDRTHQLFHIQCNKLEVDHLCLVRLEVRKAGDSLSSSSKQPVKLSEAELLKPNAFSMMPAWSSLHSKGSADSLASPLQKLSGRRQLLDPYSRPLPSRKSDTCYPDRQSAFSPPTHSTPSSSTAESTRISSISTGNRSSSFSVAKLMQDSERDD